jgi:hypothetical protein
MIKNSTFKQTFQSILLLVLLLSLTGVQGVRPASGTTGKPAATQAAAPDPKYLTAGPPMADMIVGKYPGLALGDLDSDGDPDALVADYLGRIRFYRNGGGRNLGSVFFQEQPLNYPAGLNIDLGYFPLKPVRPQPELVDYDADGDLELFIGKGSYDENNQPAKPAILYYDKQYVNYEGIKYVTRDDNPLTQIPASLNVASNPWITLSVGDLTNDGLPDEVLGYFECYPDPVLSCPYGYYRLAVLINKGNSLPLQVLSSSVLPPEVGAVNDRMIPRLVDIDGNGKLDLFVGYSDGRVEYFENTGTLTSPAFTRRTGPQNPLNPVTAAPGLAGPDIGRDARPVFSDLDFDGDLDALVATAEGTVVYFRNDGTRTSPRFSRVDDLPDPFGGLDGGIKNQTTIMPGLPGNPDLPAMPGGSAATYGDLDGDGAMDALAGGIKGGIRNFEGVPDGGFHFEDVTATKAWFTEPGSGYKGFTYAVPTLVDLDQDPDGTLDLVITAQTGAYESISTAGVGITANSPARWPAQASDTMGNPSLTAVTSYTFYYYKNIGSPTEPNFVRQTGTDDPFAALTGVPDNPIPTFGDINTDGQIEMLLGSADGNIQYFINTGTTGAPSFTPSPTDNPFSSVSASYGAPFLVDYEGDGRLDLLIGQGYLYGAPDPLNMNGTIRFFENVGTPAEPSYNELSGPDNPFAWFSVREFATPALADIDGDGDLDLASGSGFGTFTYYPNIGTPGVPVYRDYHFNPLATVVSPTPDIAYSVSINLVDFAGNGIYDAFVGIPKINDVLSHLAFYKNIGTVDTPVYRLQPETKNPLSGVTSETAIINVSFGNTDDDKDLEAYVGGDLHSTGFIKYFDFRNSAYVEDSTAYATQFPKSVTLQYVVGPRIQFVKNQAGTLLDAFIYLGFVENKRGVYFAPNTGDAANPLYTYTELKDWALDSLNPFYFAYQSNTINPGFNTAWADSQTMWAGNFTGDLYTMQNTKIDPDNLTNYFGRVPEKKDVFRNVHLPGPTLVSSVDINNDTYIDAFVAAADGMVHYFSGTKDPPPPSFDGVYLPIVRK